MHHFCNLKNTTLTEKLGPSPFFIQKDEVLFLFEHCDKFTYINSQTIIFPFDMYVYTGLTNKEAKKYILYIINDSKVFLPYYF